MHTHTTSCCPRLWNNLTSLKLQLVQLHPWRDHCNEMILLNHSSNTEKWELQMVSVLDSHIVIPDSNSAALTAYLPADCNGRKLPGSRQCTERKLRAPITSDVELKRKWRSFLFGLKYWSDHIRNIRIVLIEVSGVVPKWNSSIYSCWHLLIRLKLYLSHSLLSTWNQAEVKLVPNLG